MTPPAASSPGPNVGDPAELGAGRATYHTAAPALPAALKAATMADATDEQPSRWRCASDYLSRPKTAYEHSREIRDRWGRMTLALRYQKR
ncbi:hypothetical protein GCM10023191_089030 [Actinoallomurus oryzae]|uniref:Uncharacterized protein n=1 Tax=Actinoallomurus oryzae TaxID=502180 RepID=A0ABP8R3F2_9ACTN